MLFVVVCRRRVGERSVTQGMAALTRRHVMGVEREYTLVKSFSHVCHHMRRIVRASY